MSDTLWLIGTDLAAQYSALHTEIRAIDSFSLENMIKALNIFEEIIVLHRDNIGEIPVDKLITVSEKISLQVAKEYYRDAKMIIDTIFLRYDESNVKTLKPVIYDRKSSESFDRDMMLLAFNEAEKSSDWWRHVGAVLVRDKCLLKKAYNHPVPSEQMPYVFGNPRDFIKAGALSHFSDAMHAEKSLFAYALKNGICTSGADIYVSVFPCPDCAKLIAYSGIRRCFFGSGHASLDGQAVLQSQNVELIYVPL